MKINILILGMIFASFQSHVYADDNKGTKKLPYPYDKYSNLYVYYDGKISSGNNDSWCKDGYIAQVSTMFMKDGVIVQENPFGELKGSPLNAIEIPSHRLHYFDSSYVDGVFPYSDKFVVPPIYVVEVDGSATLDFDANYYYFINNLEERYLAELAKSPPILASGFAERVAKAQEENPSNTRPPRPNYKQYFTGIRGMDRSLHQAVGISHDIYEEILAVIEKIMDPHGYYYAHNSAYNAGKFARTYCQAYSDVGFPTINSGNKVKDGGLVRTDINGPYPLISELEVKSTLSPINKSHRPSSGTLEIHTYNSDLGKWDDVSGYNSYIMGMYFGCQKCFSSKENLPNFRHKDRDGTVHESWVKNPNSNVWTYDLEHIRESGGIPYNP